MTQNFLYGPAYCLLPMMGNYIIRAAPYRVYFHLPQDDVERKQ